VVPGNASTVASTGTFTLSAAPTAAMRSPSTSTTQPAWTAPSSAFQTRSGCSRKAAACAGWAGISESANDNDNDNDSDSDSDNDNDSDSETDSDVFADRTKRHDRSARAAAQARGRTMQGMDIFGKRRARHFAIKEDSSISCARHPALFRHAALPM